MKSHSSLAPLAKDVLLLGGGHSHIQVLKRFAMQPEPGVRLTLVSPDLTSPYSGMLPGAIAREYTSADIHIQLAPLCQRAGARLVLAEAEGLDAAAQQVFLAGRPPMHYDVLSLNCGAIPRPPQEGVATVKPISEFLPKWEQSIASLSENAHLIIVGGGAGGVELALAARTLCQDSGRKLRITLVGEHLLKSHGEKAQKLIARELLVKEISVRRGRVQGQDENGIVLLDSSGRTESLAADEVFWVTDVQAHTWLRESGLATDEGGFVSVNRHLQSISHENVFAAGDTAHLVEQERPKSGVFAVRAGPILATNIRHYVLNKRLKRFHAQKKHLALLGLGEGRALASRGKWASTGRVWWWLKQRIDRRFMRQFNELDEMVEETFDLPPSLAEALPDDDMRCGGCGAKLAAAPLERVLSRLDLKAYPDVLLGVGDDAAEIKVTASTQVVSIDGFRAMVDDPYLFGRIATHHSLNDIFAMAAKPTTAMALATVPLMAEALIEEELFQLMSGVVSVLNEHETALVGGHSAEGLELSLGLAVSGTPGHRAVAKSGAQVGDVLVLTKPIGTGVVMAWAMRGSAAEASLKSALEQMDKSNAPALELLQQAGVTALTDVTGFGLLGHLGEMLRAGDVGASVTIDSVPVIPGADVLLTEVSSSLQVANELVFQDIELKGNRSFGDPRVRLMVDPQTSGGLLATVPASASTQLVGELSALGYTAAVIGVITDSGWVLE